MDQSRPLTKGGHEPGGPRPVLRRRVAIVGFGLCIAWGCGDAIIEQRRAGRFLEVIAHPHADADLNHLPAAAGEVVAFLRQENLVEYRIDQCAGSVLEFQRIIEASLPSKRSAQSSHLIQSATCAHAPDAPAARAINSSWSYVFHPAP
jgi:hypothetical protein